MLKILRSSRSVSENIRFSESEVRWWKLSTIITKFTMITVFIEIINKKLIAFKSKTSFGCFERIPFMRWLSNEWDSSYSRCVFEVSSKESRSKSSCFWMILKLRMIPSVSNVLFWRNSFFWIAIFSEMPPSNLVSGSAYHFESATLR